MKSLKASLYLLFLAFVSSAQNQLVIPDTLAGTAFNLVMKDSTKVFYPGFTTVTTGINADYLGPTLILNRGDSVQMHVTNLMGDTTTLHWHGLHVSPRNDGGPHVFIQPGDTWSPAWKVRDHAATYWYHPHLHMKTNLQVSRGAAGLIIVRDSIEATLALPRRYGVDDFPLVVQSRCFDAGKQITVDNHSDSVLLVNGTLNPYLQVPAQVVRFRVLNGSPERVINIGLQNNTGFFQIGSDGGLLDAPVPLTRLRLAPGERAELLVDFSTLNGQNIDLMSYAAELPNAIYGALQPGMGAGQTLPGYSANALNGANFRILQLQVGPPTVTPITTVPAALVTNSPLPAAGANTTRQLTFMPMNMGPAAIQGPFMINNQMYDPNVINYTIPLGHTEIWTLTNQSPIAHPFHIHDVQFYVLDINGVAPPPSQAGRKDVVLVPAGMGTVRFIAKFEEFCDSVYPYMYHCHMLTHEDHGMMGQFLVECPTPTGVAEGTDKDQDVSVYPNPGKGLFNLEWGEGKQVERAVVLDMRGKVVFQINAITGNGIEIDLSGLEAGIYVVRLMDGYRQHVLKLVKD